PVTLASLLMGNRRNPEKSIKLHEVDGIRKAVDQTLSSLGPPIPRVGGGASLEPGEGGLDLGSIFPSESGPLAVVIVHRVIELGCRFTVEPNRLHGCFSRERRNTSSAGMPISCPLRISSMRR